MDIDVSVVLCGILAVAFIFSLIRCNRLEGRLKRACADRTVMEMQLNRVQSQQGHKEK